MPADLPPLEMTDADRATVDRMCADALAGWSGLTDEARKRLAVAWRDACSSKRSASGSKRNSADSERHSL